jgi:hypothetical protein
LELAGYIMFPDNSGDSVPAFLLPILTVRIFKRCNTPFWQH